MSDPTSIQPDAPSAPTSVPARGASDALLRQALAAVGEYGIIIADADGRIIEWNTGAQRIFGWTPDEALGRTPDFLFTENDLRLGKPAAELAYLREAPGAEEEGWRVRKSGAPFWASVVLVPLRDGDRFQGLARIVRDITERKKSEWLERDSRHVLEMVTRNQPLDVVLNRVAELLERQCAGMCASILLLCDGELSCAAAPRVSEHFLTRGDPRVLRLAVGLMQRVQDVGQPMAATDITDDPIWNDLRGPAARLGFNSCWSAPIVNTAGEILGVMLLCGPVHHAPDRADFHVIEIAGRLTAMALDQRNLADQLAHQARHDLLTGLPNRATFEDRLYMAISRAARDAGEHVAVCLIDLDRFKYVNDTFGHEAGDDLLRQVAARWRPLKRDHDTLARLGGDEFGLVLPALSNRADAVRIVQRFVGALRQPIHIAAAGHDLAITASVGVAVFPHDGLDAATLERNADVAMYRVKEHGRNGFQCFESEMNRKAVERLELEAQLRRALADNALELHYQPQADPAGRLVGFEALLRWNHPRLGQLLPVQFIPMAEETGLVVPINQWAMSQACQQAVAWRRAGRPPVRVAVHVSATQFARADFPGQVAATLHDAGLDPVALELEFNEAVLVKNVHDAVAKLSALRTLGVALSIDDFGTGYTSLAYLHHLPIDTLKIDRTMVAAITPAALVTPNANDTAVIRAVCSLAQNLGLAAVAEGVETECQREFLLRLGCRAMQGNLFGAPVPVAAADSYWQSLSPRPLAA